MNSEVTANTTIRKNHLTLLRIELEDILKRARQLDGKALAQIHDRYYPEIYRYVCYRLNNDPVCEDITSEVFLRLLDSLHRQRGPKQSLRGWLLGTASNLVNDHLRRRYNHPVDNLDDQEGSEYLSGEPTPENRLEDHLIRQRVGWAIQQLTEEQQHVLALRFSEERSLVETAKIVGKTVMAVKALQFRALASLRRLLDEEREP